MNEPKDSGDEGDGSDDSDLKKVTETYENGAWYEGEVKNGLRHG